MTLEKNNTLLRAIDRPLRFLQESQLSNPAFVKNLVSHVQKTCESAKSHPSTKIRVLFADVGQWFDQFFAQDMEQKKETISKVLTRIDQVEEDLSQPVLFQSDDHPIYTIDQIREKQKELDKRVQFVKGVGPVIAEKFLKARVLTLADLFSFLPTRYEDRKTIVSIGQLQDGQHATILGEICFQGMSYYKGLRRRVFEMVVDDSSGQIKLKWFQFHYQSLEKKVKRGAKVIVSGKVKRYRNQMEMHHPDFEIFSGEKDALSFGRIIPIYREIGNLYQKTLRKIMFEATTRELSSKVCLLPPDICEKMNFLPPWKALQKLHLPEVLPTEDQKALWERHLAFEELFFYTFALLHRKIHQKRMPGIAFDGPSPRSDILIGSLPFELTDAQKEFLGRFKRI
ncbi:MAG: OB-fold nucleic acid binding domain-containing protein [Bdellovibrionota bacterium]